MWGSGDGTRLIIAKIKRHGNRPTDYLTRNICSVSDRDYSHHRPGAMMAQKTRGLYYVDRTFANRKLGLLKKAYEISQMTQAHVALLIECDGSTYSFQSDDWFAPHISDIPMAYRVEPGDIAEIIQKDKATIRRREERKKGKRNEGRAIKNEHDGIIERAAVGKGSLGLDGTMTEAAALQCISETSLGDSPPSSAPGGALRPAYYPLAADFFQARIQ